MNRLKARDLKGIWAAIPMPWDHRFRFDEDIYRTNIARMIQAKVHGVYTTGSTGEFYAIDFDEFKRMVDIQAELCGQREMRLQIGCNSDATHKTIRLLEYAAGKKEVGAVQVAIPYWMELSDREVLQFFQDLSHACPDLPLMHYNTPRTKRYLRGEDYLRILDHGVNLIGVKYTVVGSNFGNLQDDIALTPGLSYFVAENLLASAMQMGARGSCSSIVLTNPAFMLKMYAKCEAAEWHEALQTQRLLAKFFGDSKKFITDRNEGGMDPVFDKGLAVASGCISGHQRCRPPYIGWSDATVKAMRAWLKEKYPEFLYPA